MAKQVLNTGTSNNDKSGDTLRAGGLKIKANFDEIYAALANDGANISGGNLLKSGSYADLRNKPEFSSIALSGSWDDINDKPAIVTSTATPGNLIGYEGQTAGQIAFDGNNLYVSTAAYDGESQIWKYVPWGGSGTTQGYSYTHNQDPTVAGGFSLDSEIPTQATVAYISTLDISENDIHPFYQYIFDNNLSANLEIISRTNPSNRALFRITGSSEMEANATEYYELNLTPILSTNGMTIGTGVWDLHFDFTGADGSGGNSLINGNYTVELNAQGNLTIPQRLIIGGASSDYESHLEIDAANYWTSIQWTNLAMAQDPDATPFECHAQLLRVFRSAGEVDGHEELVAISVVNPTGTTQNGLMLTTSDGKIPDAPYNDGIGTMHNWIFGGDGNLILPSGGDIKRDGNSVLLSNNRFVSVPTASTGAEGDQAGDIAFSGSHLYYCINDYNGTQYSYNSSTGESTSAVGLKLKVDTDGVLPDLTGYVVTGPNITGTVLVTGPAETAPYGSTYFPIDTDFYQTSGTYTFSPGVNIWKRVAWSNDTW